MSNYEDIEKYKIKGKYQVVELNKLGGKIITDNPLEAVWEANKFPGLREIRNICGEVEFYKENGKYKIKR